MTTACTGNNRALLALLVLVLSSFLLQLSEASYVVSIMPSSKECFQFHTPNGVSSLSSISGSFEVLHDDVDSDEVTVRVFNVESGDTLYEVPSGEQEGDFEFESLKSNSRYKICFQNNAEGSHEDDAFDMGFNLRFHDPPRTLEQDESGPDGERATKLVEKASKIHQDWDTLQDHFDFLRNREAIHEDMNYEIVSKLTKWTWIEAVLVCGMAVGQTMYWKKFFEKRRYL